MNPFYSFKLSVQILQNWMDYFDMLSDISYPPTIKLIDCRFGRACVSAASQQELLSFYGCLDSELL